MTTLGVLFAIAAAIAYLRGPSAFVVVLAASAAFPASAAITIGANALTPFSFMGILAGGSLLFDRRRVITGAGRTALLILVAWSLVITTFGPIVFRGQAVLSARDGIDNAIVSPSELEFGISSVAQSIYLVVGAIVVVFLARSSVGPRVVALPFAIATTLSALCALCSLVGVPWPSELFDTNPNVIYSDTSDSSAGATVRLRGIFNEPSELAGFSLAAAAYFAVAAAKGHGLARLLSILLGGLALLNLSLSSSGTAALGVVMFAAVGASAILINLVRSGGRSAPFVLFGLLAITLLGVVFGGEITTWMDTIVNGKIGSDSYVNRTASDRFSLGILADTGGIGVGLGANRPSSFVTMMLSCVGIIGTGALVVFVTALIHGAARVAAAQPVIWALIALLIAKSVSLPDLSTPILWLLLGSCAGTSWIVADPRHQKPLGAPSIRSPEPTRKAHRTSGHVTTIRGI